jgi:predicted Zn-dependent protease
LFRLSITLCITLLLLAGTAGAQEVALPQLGSSADRVLSLKDEQAWGDMIMTQIRGNSAVVRDPLANEYIRGLGFRLVAANPDAAEHRFDFFLINEPSINAFAMPGGYIGIMTGLVLTADVEDELAGVLAHEIAHVTQRHTARRFEQMSDLQLPMVLAMIGAVLAGGSNPQAAIGGIMGSMAGREQLLRNYSRQNEAEADRIGIKTLAAAGFLPQGMASFFEKLLDKYRHSPRPLEFLSTHPITERRVADAKLRIQDLPANRLGDQARFWLIQERLRVLASQTQPLTREQFLDRIAKASGPKKAAIEHGFALWLIRDGDAGKAMTIARQLYEDNPKSIEAATLYIDALTAGRDYPRAIDIGRRALALSPMNYPLTLSYARALMESGQPLEALNAISALAYQYPKDPAVLELLADVQHRAGREAESHETTGIYLWVIGDLSGAQLQFRRALRERSDDPYFFTRVRGRLQELEAQQMQLKGRQRGR